MHRALIALALLLPVSLASAQVYKWKDASGTVHYSETPPPSQATKYKQMTPAADAPATPAAAPAAAPAPAASAPAQTTVADTPENRAKLCGSLKTNLAALQGSGAVVMQQGDKQTALDAAQRKQQADASQAQYQLYCQSK